LIERWFVVEFCCWIELDWMVEFLCLIESVDCLVDYWHCSAGCWLGICSIGPDCHSGYFESELEGEFEL
jgi:hypothetical protein